tara:strand:- start:75 stop:1529 length:1455 start_codon:yes stop_codon:yes gene_type:complete
VSLKYAALSSTRWTTASTVLRAAIQFLQIIILARILAPEDFGLMAMAGAATAVASILADLGLSSALMHFPRPNRQTLSAIYWLNLGLACFLAAVFALSASPIAQIYGNPELLPVLFWLSLVFPISAAGHLFRVLAEKDLKFRLLAQQEVVAVLAGFVIALILAFQDAGVYALVGSVLVTSATSTALAWILLSKGSRPTMTSSFANAKPFLAYGLHRVGDGLWNTLRMQADIFIAGVYATPAAVAIYATPREQCLRIANTLVNPVVTRVSLPVLARLQGDMNAVRTVYLKTLRMTASLNFPLYCLVALFPDELVAVLLGDQWEAAAPYFRLFAIWGLIRSTGNPSGSLLYAVGMARRAHIWNLLLLIGTMPPLWLAAQQGGLIALGWTMLALQTVIFVLAWRYLVRPACGARLVEYLASIAPPLISCGFSVTLTLAIIQFIPAQWELIVGAGVMAASYTVFSWWLNRIWLTTMVELIRPIWKTIR